MCTCTPLFCLDVILRLLNNFSFNFIFKPCKRVCSFILSFLQIIIKNNVSNESNWNSIREVHFLWNKCEWYYWIDMLKEFNLLNVSEVILALGKARTCRKLNLDCREDGKHGYCNILPENLYKVRRILLIDWKCNCNWVHNLTQWC